MRARPEEITPIFETIKNQLADDGDTNAEGTLRHIAVQSLLQIGARSFSHFLNAIERYISVLRTLAGTHAEARADVLSSVADFWNQNRQMVSIVFDKLMQYQIVDPTDVVRWAFAQADSGLNWELLKGAVDKANGRVVVARKRVSTLRKEEDETRARALATDGGDVVNNMEVDAELKPGMRLCALKRLIFIR
jgi:nuclear cap-binding protein subunit 1